MNRAVPLLAAWVIAALGACGAEPEEPPRSTAEREQALRESTFAPLVETLDRAAEVEQVQRDRKREIDAALER